MSKTKWVILIISVVAIAINLLITDFYKFWEVNTLFRFSMPFLAVIVVLIIILFQRKQRRKNNL